MKSQENSSKLLFPPLLLLWRGKQIVWNDVVQSESFIKGLMQINVPCSDFGLRLFSLYLLAFMSMIGKYGEKWLGYRVGPKVLLDPCLLVCCG
jgi:hypothetical protein